MSNDVNPAYIEWRKIWDSPFEGKDLMNLKYHQHFLDKMEEYKRRGFGSTDDWEYWPQLYAGHEYARMYSPGSGMPLTFAELALGDFFIQLPMNGDNSGHGGLRHSHYVFKKIDKIDGFFVNAINMATKTKVDMSAHLKVIKLAWTDEEW